MHHIVIAVLLATLSLGSENIPASRAFRSMVETERAFAKTCSKKGVRPSFMEFFADDGIAFKPEPFTYKEFIKTLPPQPDPMAVSLKWEPQFAGVASSGDLGFTTGPSIRVDSREKERKEHHGQFFSVWKKQKDGRWKVAVDIGTAMPSPASSLGLSCKQSSMGTTVKKTRTIPSDHEREMKNVEHWFSEASLSGGVLKAYLNRSTEETRLHRENRLPIVGPDAIKSYLNEASFVPVWTPMGSDVSASGDLAYSYGSYEHKAGANDPKTLEKGYYLHVWRRTGALWKLVADITNPAEPDEKK